MMFRTCPSNPRFICRVVTEDKLQTEMKGQILNFVSLERNVTLVRRVLRCLPLVLFLL